MKELIINHLFQVKLGKKLLDKTQFQFNIHNNKALELSMFNRTK